MCVVLVGADASESWRGALEAALGERLSTPSELGECSPRIAVVVGPLTESLQRHPRLELAISLYAGVESLLDPTLVPARVAVVRAHDPSLAQAMVETVLLHVLSAHREAIAYRAAQRERRWLPLPQPLARSRRVGVLGLGQLGAPAARALAELGFPVTGWSRTPKSIPGVRCLAGEDALDRVLAGSEILVCLLPLTASTDGILDAKRLALLPRGAVLVSLGRGAQVDERALLAALDGDRLGGAILDVFAQEPLPPTHPFWSHERVLVYPHVAADPDPATGAAAVAEIVAAHRAGEALPGRVDAARGY